MFAANSRDMQPLKLTALAEGKSGGGVVTSRHGLVMLVRETKSRWLSIPEPAHIDAHDVYHASESAPQWFWHDIRGCECKL